MSQPAHSWELKMLKRALLSGLAILFTWRLLDLILHRYFLAPSMMP
jgi:hypothetical protein